MPASVESIWTSIVRASAVMGFSLVLGCSGNIAGNNNPGAPPGPDNPGGGPPNTTTPMNGGVSTTPAPAGVVASAAPLRRLSAEQYRNTIQDLLGAGDVVVLDALPQDEAIAKERFISNVSRPVQSSDADKYADAAEAVARKVTTNLPTLMGCDPAGAGEATCVNGFIERFGKRAFRRPLAQAEIARAKAVFTAGRASGDAANGVRLMLQAMLQSVNFLYLFELAPVDAVGKVMPVDSWALASRLSYFLLNSMPDDPLFAAAESGQLATPDQLATQARRLMGTQRFRDMVASFHFQWLELGELKAVDKDVKLFPAWNEPLRAAMLEEPRRFVDSVMRDGDGRIETLLTAPFSVLSGPLYDLYGAPRPASTTDWQKTSLDPKQRAGLLTMAGLMTSLAKEDRTSFIRRGKLIREGFLCTPVLDPPPNVDASEAMIPATADARTRAAAHRDQPACAPCHAMFDPLGFAFETYDAIGRYRTMENGKAVDSHADITMTAGLNGTVKDAVEMAGKLASSDEVRECVARQWMRFGLGRDDNDDDRQSLGEVMKGFKTGNWKVSEMLLSLAQSDSFRYQKVKP
jgi:hypothetical protein